MLAYALGEIVLNDLGVNENEIIDVLKIVEESGVEYQVGDTVFRRIDGVVVGVRKVLNMEESKALLFRTLWHVKPYPKWLIDISKNVEMSGPHYLMITSGEERFPLRSLFSERARLVLNTGREDIYVSRYKPEITEVPYIAVYGGDVLENLRRAYSVLKHTDLNGPIYYDTIELLECDCEVPNLSEIEGLIKALKIFREELIDVRILREACMVLRRD